ncbi:nucleotidyltransferase [Streptomyces sp. NPDC086091]|uniref:nucleotidyltransferase n=1 Tax=Streptomyces sp. NPDC086091 TaxID=3365751 RepID=UPI0037FADADB
MTTDHLLDRFRAALAPLEPLALWAHGSLAGGDYREGRSDLDLIAVLPGPVRPVTAWRVAVVHQSLRAEPLAGGLHCSYLTPATAADPARGHLTWAHGGLTRRPVTPVTRRELHTFGRVLAGAAPTGLLPPVTDAELAAFVVADQRDYWRPALDDARLWTRDIWIDLGLITHARAAVTLREGRLITKREALAELLALGAPPEAVEDVRLRRYGGGTASAPMAGEAWRERRAGLVCGWLGRSVDRLVAAYG